MSKPHNPSANQDEILDARDAAQYLKVSKETLLRLADSGQIPGYLVGQQWLFSTHVLDAHCGRKWFEVTTSIHDGKAVQARDIELGNLPPHDESEALPAYDDVVVHSSLEPYLGDCHRTSLESLPDGEFRVPYDESEMLPPYDSVCPRSDWRQVDHE